jgi:hypothetical protein
LHSFSPADNQRDVELRRRWEINSVLDELFLGYEQAATAIDESGGALDGVGLGEWMHGGDVREAVDALCPYTSEGVEIAFELLLERSGGDRPRIDVTIGQHLRRFGGRGQSVGTLTTDLETFVRLCGGRRPDPARYVLAGAVEQDLILFS